EPHFSPDPAWGDPTTGIILDIDGVPRVYTLNELRDKIALDIWYHFAGTVPTAAVLNRIRTLTPPNVVGVLGLTTFLRDYCGKRPTPPELLLTRPEAVNEIRTVLGIDYPVP